MTKRHARILAPVICLMGVTFTPVSKSKLENYKSKQIEYSERLRDYGSNNFNIADKYEKAQSEYMYYREKFNQNINLDKQIEELRKRREKYLNLTEEYASALDVL